MVGYGFWVSETGAGGLVGYMAYIKETVSSSSLSLFRRALLNGISAAGHFFANPLG